MTPWRPWVTALALERGIKLPKYELDYIGRILPSIDFEQRRAALTEYVNIWANNTEACDSHIAVKRFNVGRYAANTWLRTRR